MLPRIFSLSAMLFCAATAMLCAPTAMAQQGYTVQGVEVSATASDGTAARMAAMEQGEGEAFTRLLQQLMPSEQAAARRASVQPYQISRMVRGYEVHEEKVTSNSYSAVLDVAFDPAQVSAFVNGAPSQPAMTPPTGMPPVMAQPPVARAVAPRPRANVLVLPVWAGDEQPLLWESANMWRKAWNQAERTDTQFIRLPIGDQSDRMVMDAAQATAAPYTAFSPIAERYQSSTVLVAIARPTVSSGVNALGVNLRTLDQNGQVTEAPMTYEQQDGESAEMLMTRAAEDIIRRVMREAQARSLQQAQAAQTLQQPNAYAPLSKLTVLSRLQQLSDWVVLRKRLLTVPGIERVDMSAISSQQVDMVVQFRGSPVQLESNMAARGINVSKAANYWVIGLRP